MRVSVRVGFLLMAVGLAYGQFVPRTEHARVRATSFVENQGQATASVLWQARGSGFDADFTADSFILRVATKGKVAEQRISFPGANPHARIEPLDPQPGKMSFFLGSDSRHWATGLPTYARLRYKDIYPGIDLLFYSNHDSLEYDFVAAPGSDPSAIRLRVDEGGPMLVNERGELQVGEGAEAVLHRPLLYQNTDRGKNAIEGQFVEMVNGDVGLEFAGYDRSRTLVIDPTLNLLYATYLGGPHDDESTAIWVDTQGNSYILGWAGSTNYPVSANAYQPQRALENAGVLIDNAVLTKITPGGVLLYSTFLGGSTGEKSGAIAVDAAGNAYITGTTNSTDFPVTANAFQKTNLAGSKGSAFVSELSPDGSTLIYSTYFGPASGSSSGNGHGVALSQGNIYFIGTSGPGLTTTTGAYLTQINSGNSAFVAILNPSLTGSAQLVASTYYGAATPAANGNGPGNLGFSLALDGSGNVWITGQTYTNNLPTTANALQGTIPALNPSCNGGGANLNSAAYLAKLSANMQSLLYGSYFSGQTTGSQVNACSEFARTVQLDSSGNIYLTGATASATFPTTANAIQRTYPGSNNFVGFVSKLNPTATQVLWSSYIGGNGGYTFPAELTLDSQGNPWVGGVTQGGTNFPLSQGAFQSAVKGNSDGFVTEFSPDGTQVLYSSYIGGSSDDVVQALGLDTQGNVYLAGDTSSTNFPVTSNAFQSVFADGLPNFDGGDIFFAVLGGGAIGVISPSSGGNGGDTSVTISGAGFQQGATCALTMGTTTITATAVTVASGGSSMTCTFGLQGAAAGSYNIVVTNPGAAALTESNAFAVAAGGQPQIWVNVIGRPVIRTGTPSRFDINIGNSGSVNAYLIPFWIHAPAGSAFAFPGGLLVNGVDYSTAAAFYGTDGSIYMPFVIPALLAGQSMALPLDLTSASNTSLFEVDAYTDLPWFVTLSDAQAQIAAGIANPASLPTACLPQQAPYALNCLGYFANQEAAIISGFTYGTVANGVFTSGTNPFSFTAAMTGYLTDLQQSLPTSPGAPASGTRVGSQTGTSPTATAANPIGAFIGTDRSVSKFQYNNATWTNCTPQGGTYSCSPANNSCGVAAQCQDWQCQMTVNGVTSFKIFTTYVSGGGQGASASCSPPSHPSCPAPGTSVRPATAFQAAAALSATGNIAAGGSAAGGAGGCSCGGSGGSVDPNDKGGPAGDASTNRYISGAQALSYQVAFENQPTATLPAAQVVVTDQLDGSKVDLKTLTLGVIAFGSTTINLPSGAASYNTLININSTLSVRIQGSLNPDTGLLKWTFTSIDPTTGLPPSDPTVGFLPPDTDGIKGQGSVVFSVMPKSGIATGTQITNTATVVFDANAPISTPTWLNTLDVTAPTSAVQALPATETQLRFAVSWSGTDAGSGIATYNIYVSDNNGPFTLWQGGVTATSATYIGTAGHTYSFYSIATDNVGNVQAAKSTADASTTVSSTASQFSLNPTSASVGADASSGTVTVTSISSTATWTAVSNSPFLTITSGASGTGSGTVGYSVATNTTGASRTGTLTIAGLTFTVTQSSVAGLAFYPVTPCRLVDTRGATGPFGGPIMSAGSIRNFTIPGSCTIPSTAQAFSLNITVVPPGPLGYLTAWPTGQAQPLVSTLNAYNGAVVANAAIVPAGTGGQISIFVSDATHVIIDINGYFALPGGSGALAFYPVTPCRVADTRTGTGQFGAPGLPAGGTRNFAVPQSNCLIPSSAQAYSLNMTVVPPGPLDYLTTWPTGLAQPLVSTLNALQGQIAANAAIVPAGSGGSISVFVSDASNVIVDINGYFAPPGGAGALYFYPVTPCRIADTRGGGTATFGPPALSAGAPRTFTIPQSSCGLPGTAAAYSLNMTVVPPGPLLYLSTWPAGQSQPVVSTLNDVQGQVVANAAIVPAGASGGISVFAYAATNLIIDVNGYFGQ